jgi:hypothetical protein
MRLPCVHAVYGKNFALLHTLPLLGPKIEQLNYLCAMSLCRVTTSIETNKLWWDSVGICRAGKAGGCAMLR